MKRAIEHNKARRRRNSCSYKAAKQNRVRLKVRRTNKYIYADLISIDGTKTLAAVSAGANIAGAQVVGRAIAEKAAAAGIKQITFDRGGYQYHGCVRALADAARAVGLDF